TSLTRDGHLVTWDTGGKLVKKWPSKILGDVVFAQSLDGKIAATAFDTLTLWNLENSSEIAKVVTRPLDPIVALAFAPDNKKLAAGGWDSVIRIYNLNAKNPAERKEQQICEGHLSAVFAVAFSKDGRTLVSGSFDRTVRLWEAFSGKQIANFKGHVGEVHGV